MNKDIIRIILITSMIYILTACSDVQFNGNRTGNNTEFKMDYTVLNKLETHEMKLLKDDVIDVNIESISGSLNVEVVSTDGDKVYIGNDADTGMFQLNIPETDTYIFKVDGTKAKGSVSFVRLEN